MARILWAGLARTPEEEAWRWRIQVTGKADLNQKMRWAGETALESSLEYRVWPRSLEVSGPERRVLTCPQLSPPEVEATPKPPGREKTRASAPQSRTGTGQPRRAVTVTGSHRSMLFPQLAAPRERASPPGRATRGEIPSAGAPPAPGRRMEWSPSRVQQVFTVCYRYHDNPL